MIDSFFSFKVLAKISLLQPSFFGCKITQFSQDSQGFHYFFFCEEFSKVAILSKAPNYSLMRLLGDYMFFANDLWQQVKERRNEDIRQLQS